MVTQNVIDSVAEPSVEGRVDVRRHDLDHTDLISWNVIQLLAQGDAESVDAGFGWAVDGEETKGQEPEPGRGEKEGGWFAEREEVRE
jgi:nicotinamide mononucleotide (NMN) deamidase PncC